MCVLVFFASNCIGTESKELASDSQNVKLLCVRDAYSSRPVTTNVVVKGLFVIVYLEICDCDLSVLVLYCLL